MEVYRDGSPIAGGQGQTAGTYPELVTTGAQAAVIKKKKRKCMVTEAQMAVKEKKRAQSGGCKTAKPADGRVTGRVTQQWCGVEYKIANKCNHSINVYANTLDPTQIINVTANIDDNDKTIITSNWTQDVPILRKVHATNSKSMAETAR